ncbi:uncharacterized protein LOC133484751 isoform X2 [Phyllopteryx taeniolatus]|uniref:uncharacterized protein LOC133484751 isoform X2 n=1 Tax=Phyllopteryx taeniolatus TaxID=161469 RepID=UPI002AD55FFF|nr:uncharacterized protein LOC133484751 isoform X2 [Phyllopteryx taeniolatus]
MRATAELMVLLFTVSQGVGDPCDGRRKGAQCYGPLAQEIVLHLMDKTPLDFTLTKEKKHLLIWRSGQLQTKEPERFSFTPNDGMMKIENLIKNDTGNYTLFIYNQTGFELENRRLQLFVEAPVTSIHLVSKCLSQGLQLVSCSSKGGDNLQYWWNLNQKPLEHTDLISGHVQENNITLKKHVSGQLVCSIRNNVSKIQKEVSLSCVFINCTSNGTLITQWLPEISKTLCDNPTSGSKTPQSKNYLPIMSGILSALVILLMIGLVIVFMQKKKKSDRKDEEELVYADVRIVDQPRRSIKVREEVEVEYGQVKFSEQPCRTVAMKDDGTVYAQVRRDRSWTTCCD